jgi:hypothetical protein
VKTFVICLIALLAAIPAFGQWEYGGIQIGYGPIMDIGLQPRLCPDNTGGVCVVWTASLEDRPGREIALCHFDTSGRELFPGGVLLVTNDSLDQSMPAIAPDDYGCCYVVWTDHRDFPDRQHGTLYAQRVAPNGTKLWGNGVRLFYTPGYAPDVYPLRGTDICSDRSFGMVAVCKLDTGYLESVLIAQMLDGNGNRLWDSLGVVIHSGSGIWLSNFVQPHLIASGQNFFCAWPCRISNETVGIYMQKFDQDGNIYFGQDGLSVITDNQGGSGNEFDDRGVQIIPDGYRGVVIGWLYDILSLGPTIRADRISSSGQSLWRINGKKLLPEERSQRWGLGLYQFGSGNSARFMAVMLGGYQANYQILDLSGNLLLGDSGGVFTQGTFFATTEYADTLYAVQELDTLYYYYFGSKRDISGNEYWPNPPYIHGWIDDNLEIIPDRLGGMYVTFVLYRDFRTDWVYIQRIYPDGHFGGDTVSVSEPQPPLLPDSPFNLSNYPNPFNGQTIISYYLDKDTRVSLHIYSIMGHLVMPLVNKEIQSQGEHKYIWEGRDERGKAVSTGVYFYELYADDSRESKAMIMLK